MESEIIMTPSELAELLRVEVSDIEAALRGGQLKGILIGTKWRVMQRHVLDEFRYHGHQAQPQIVIEHTENNPRQIPAPDGPAEIEATILATNAEPYERNGVTYGVKGSTNQPPLKPDVEYVLGIKKAGEMIGWSEPLVLQFLAQGQLPGSIMRFEGPNHKVPRWYIEKETLQLFIEVNGIGPSGRKSAAPASQPDTQATPQQTAPPAKTEAASVGPHPNEPLHMSAKHAQQNTGDSEGFDVLVIKGKKKAAQYLHLPDATFERMFSGGLIEWFKQRGEICFSKMELDKVANSLHSQVG